MYLILNHYQGAVPKPMVIKLCATSAVPQLFSFYNNKVLPTAHTKRYLYTYWPLVSPFVKEQLLFEQQLMLLQPTIAYGTTGGQRPYGPNGRWWYLQYLWLAADMPKALGLRHARSHLEI